MTLPLPAQVGLHVSDRHGGVSEGVYASLNLGASSGDLFELVTENRRRLAKRLGVPCCWMTQQHGVGVIETTTEGEIGNGDIMFTEQINLACTVTVADCVPIAFASKEGKRVAVAHAGWRGIAGGVIERAAALFSDTEWLAILGPHIGSSCYPIMDDVKQQLLGTDQDCFTKTTDEKWLADLGELVTRRLERSGCSQVSRVDICTSCDDNYYSVRRDGQATGRFAVAIWLKG